MPRANVMLVSAIVILLSATGALRAEDLPTLQDRIVTTLYGPAYRLLFLGERSVPVWIRAYNSTLKGAEMPGLREYFNGVFFERYKICDPDRCDSNYLVVLFTPGGREAWAVAVSNDERQFFGHPDPVTQQHLVSAEK